MLRWSDAVMDRKKKHCNEFKIYECPNHSGVGGEVSIASWLTCWNVTASSNSSRAMIFTLRTNILGKAMISYSFCSSTKDGFDIK